MSEEELKANIGKKVLVVFVRYGVEGLDKIERDLKLKASGRLQSVEDIGIKLKNSIELFGYQHLLGGNGSLPFFVEERDMLPFKSEQIKIERIYLEEDESNRKLIYGKKSECNHLEFFQYRQKRNIPDDLEDQEKIEAEYRCGISGKPCAGNKNLEYNDNHGGPIPEAVYSSNLAKECRSFCLKK